MIIQMKLKHDPFEKIKNGSKTIEMRLYDEKRRSINIGDIIEFSHVNTGEIIKAEVVALHIFPDFEAMYQYFDKVSIGYTEEEIADPQDMTQYYSLDQQKQYQVVGIEIKLI